MDIAKCVECHTNGVHGHYDPDAQGVMHGDKRFCNQCLPTVVRKICEHCNTVIRYTIELGKLRIDDHEHPLRQQVHVIKDPPASTQPPIRNCSGPRLGQRFAPPTPPGTIRPPSTPPITVGGGFFGGPPWL